MNSEKDTTLAPNAEYNMNSGRKRKTKYYKDIRKRQGTSYTGQQQQQQQRSLYLLNMFDVS